VLADDRLEVVAVRVVLKPPVFEDGVLLQERGLAVEVILGNGEVGIGKPVDVAVPLAAQLLLADVGGRVVLRPKGA